MDAPPLQYTTTSDGYNIAYCVSGAGTPLVMAPAPFNNLHLMWQPGNRATKFFRPLAERFRLVQYDSRGHGMSSRGLRPEHSMADYVLDLEAVVQVVGLQRFVLLGGPLFANVAERYALAHPDKVSGLILIDDGSGDPWGGKQGMGRLEDTARDNWRSYITFMAGGVEATPELWQYYHQSVQQEDVLRMMRATYGAGIDDRLPDLQVPTLVIGTRAASHDNFVESAKRTAALIPNAQLALFENWPRHLYPDDDSLPPVIPVIEQFVRGLPSETPQASAATVADVGLSSREVEVLRLLAAGYTNHQIAEELVISRNTVRRHVSNIFDKTGAANRAQAAIYAKDHGLA